MGQVRNFPLGAAFLGFVVVLVLANFTASQGAPPTTSTLVLTRNVDEPARNAFQTGVHITIPHAQSSNFAPLAVPAGKRLVVEFVSVHGNVLHGRTLLVHVSASGDVGAVNHEIALNDPRPLGNDIYTASQPVRIYAEPNAGLVFRALHSGALSGPEIDSEVSINISGYFVDVP